MNLLIVDDNATNLKLLRVVLEAEGHTVFEAVDGVEALNVLAREKMDAVISDILMPRMDGYGLCYEVRASERFRRLPFIIYTATYTSPSDEKLALDLGADKFLRKPAPPKVIVATLHEVTSAERRPPKLIEPPQELHLMKEYNEVLVTKLEEKNIELAEKVAMLLRTEQQLRLQSAALETTADGIMITDRKGLILWVNPAFTTLTGYVTDEALGRNPRLLKSGTHDRAFYKNLWDTILRGETWRGGFRNRRKDGSFYDDEHTITPIRQANGAITHFVAIMHDVTERKRAQEELRSTHEKLHQLLAYSPAVLYTLAIKGAKVTPVVVSDNIERLLGVTVREASYDWWLESLHPQDRDRVVADFAKGVAQGGYSMEYRLRHKDGSYRWVEDNSRVLRGDSSQPEEAVGVWTDITERKSLEEQFRQAQKMEAFGQLAGGVAHDFNNLLTVINGFSEIVASGFHSEDPNRKMLKEVQKAGDRAASLTRQLLAFSRKQVLEPRVLDLNAVVTDIEKMLRRLIGEDVTLTTVLNPTLGRVKVDPGQIEQVIVNLAVNARDAMPTGGNLTIETSNVILDETYATTHPEAVPGRFVLLAVSDSGRGMTAEVQARIFEPFFTTKGPGKGTGLGLATVYGIIKQSGGHIGVYSEPGRGTSFKIYLPSVEEEVSTGKSFHGVKLTQQGTETILVVEDEDAVRTMTCFALRMFGYTVLEANHGTEALRLGAQHQGPIHLLVTDVVMPEMGGRQLVERLTQVRPDLKVLYLSGYTDDAVVRHGILQADVAFLQKPFTPTTLANKVREVLA